MKGFFYSIFIMATKKELEEKVKQLESVIALQKIINTKVIDIIYPNVEKFAQWEELKYSLRSLEKNLRDVEFRVWIVGDWPVWMDPEEAYHIPCDYTGSTPRIDILHKHLAVIEDSMIGEEYFWMNDDIYFVNPVQYADMCLNVAINNLLLSRKVYNKQTLWGHDVLNTYDTLKKAGLPTWNYAAHIPHRFEKQKVKQLIEEFDMLQNRIDLQILYYNYWFRNYYPYMDTLELTNNQGFSVNRPDPNTVNLEAQLKVKKYMNNGEGGMGPVLQKYLKHLFPEKSRFEV